LNIIKSTDLLEDFRTYYDKDLLAYVETFMTESRKSILREVLEKRTKYLTLVSENFIDQHNIHACIRSSECFGLQDFHNIAAAGVKMKPNKSVNRGATQWTHVYDYEESPQPTIDCINNLKSKGYKIYAAHLDENAFTPQNIPIDQPMAIILGKEKEGISQEALDHCNGIVSIPMYGFTESFNVSVAGSLLIQPIIARIHDSEVDWRLTEGEKELLYYEWTWHSIKYPENLYKEYNLNKLGNRF
jgi:tRNA (guanosine-2'-O-)-methyltransferase